MTIEDSYNFRRISEQVTTSGVVSAAQLGELRGEGYDAVINLLPASNEHAVKDEARIVRDQGLDDVYIPVDFDAADACGPRCVLPGDVGPRQPEGARALRSQLPRQRVLRSLRERERPVHRRRSRRTRAERVGSRRTPGVDGLHRRRAGAVQAPSPS